MRVLRFLAFFLLGSVIANLFIMGEVMYGVILTVAVLLLIGDSALEVWRESSQRQRNR